MRNEKVKRKYLVTGASGYVGGRLVRALINEKENVRVLVRDRYKIMSQEWGGDECNFGKGWYC